jgi:hypothetical protein
VPVGEQHQVRVLITTYNRPTECLRLLQDLVREARVHRLDVQVWDDASSEDYSEVKDLVRRHRWTYHRAPHHHGKRKFWAWISRIYKAQEGSTHPYTVQLPDDVRLCADFISRAVHAYRSAPQDALASVNLQADSRLSSRSGCWTGVAPRKVDKELHETAWVDGLFIAGSGYFRALAYGCPEVSGSRWDNNPNLGSGVGQAISVALHRKGMRMYCVHGSLTAHVAGESKMNPEERKKHPLGSLRFVDGDAVHTALTVSPPEPVTVCMASIPSRAGLLPRVIDSLYDQCDALKVYLNGYKTVPACLQRPRI